MLPTEVLAIKKGIPKLPGDENSAEQGVITFALHLDNAQTITGFSLDSSIGREWQPARAVVKPQQWIDSNRKDGRTLDGNAVGNVRETINVKAVAGSHLELLRRITNLQRFASDAQLFHSSFYQIEPVYLEWSMKGGKGSQYALIYDIEIAVTYNDNASGGASADIVLVIEREPAWRGIPPGAHPKLWTYYWRGLPPQPYTEFDPLTHTQPALLTDEIVNANEFDDATDGYLKPTTGKNYIDIPASDVPGDAPALVFVYMYDSDADTDAIGAYYYISRSTKPQQLKTREGNVRERLYAMPFADFDITTNLTAQADSDAPRRASDGARYAMRTSSTGGTIQIGTTHNLSAHSMRGKYNVFVRGKFTGAVASGSLFFRFRIYPATTNSLPWVDINSDPILSASHNLIYITTIDIPGHANSRLYQDGRGIQNIEDDELRIRMDYNNSTGVTFDLYDLIFVPFDEPSVNCVNDDAAADRLPIIYDSTGYSSHGKLDHVYGTLVDQTTYIDITYRPIRGDQLTLLPGVYNSLVFWIDGVLPEGNAALSIDIELDIVPRWYGVRDA